MNQLAILNNYTPDEVVAIQEQTLQVITQSVEEGTGIPSYRKLAEMMGYPVLVVTKMIEMHPDLYELMQLAKTALASEIEARVATLAMGELGQFVEDSKGNTNWVVQVSPVELGAAKMLLEANHPAYAKKPSSVTIVNPRVPVGQSGKELALSHMEELNQYLSNK